MARREQSTRICTMAGERVSIIHVLVHAYPFERLVEVRVDRVDVLRDERAEVAVQLRPPGVDRRRVRHHHAAVHEERDEDGDRRRTQAVQQLHGSAARQMGLGERLGERWSRHRSSRERGPEGNTTSTDLRGEETSRQ